MLSCTKPLLTSLVLLLAVVNMVKPEVFTEEDVSRAVADEPESVAKAERVLQTLKEMATKSAKVQPCIDKVFEPMQPGFVNALDPNETFEKICIKQFVTSGYLFDAMVSYEDLQISVMTLAYELDVAMTKIKICSAL